MQGSGFFTHWLVVIALAIGALALSLPALAKDDDGPGKGNGNGHGNAYGHSKGEYGADEEAPEPQEVEEPEAAPEPAPAPEPEAHGQPAPERHGHEKKDKGQHKGWAGYRGRHAARQPEEAPEPEQSAEPAAAPEAPVAAPQPTTEQSDARPQRRRISARSVQGTGRDRSAGGRDGAGRARLRPVTPRGGRIRGTRAPVQRSPSFTLASEGGPAPVTTAPAAGLAAGPQPSRRADGRKVSRVVVVAPPDPLPGRALPEPVREIVEVVPNELWMALAALTLLALLLGIWSWIVALRARRLKRQREVLLQEVGLLQAALLPPVPAEVPASVAYRPAEGPAAGGDFYDAFLRSDGTTGLIVGDVLGHGREALARTTLIRYTLRAYLEAGLEPREVVKTAGAALDDQLDAGFATVTVAVFDPKSARFTYASAGHHPPLVVGPGAHEPVTVCSAPPLGIGEPTGFRQSTFHVTAGSTVCVFTDGLTEARVGEQILGRERLAELVDALPADADADALLDRVAAVVSVTPDDMAVCLVRAPADAPAEGARIEELEVDEAEVGQSLEAFLRACGVPMSDVPGVLREAGEATRREGSATVRVRLNDFRPGVDVVPGNVVELEDQRRAARR